MSRGEGSLSALGAIPVGASLVAGVAAYVAGYALTFGLLLVDSRLSEGGGSAGGDGSFDVLFEFVGTLWYSAHFVPVDFEIPLGTGSVDLIEFYDLALPSLVYYAVPVLVLFVAGFVVTQRAHPASASVVGAAGAGASIALAYLPLVALGTQYFHFSFVGAEISLPLIRSALVAGVAYPVVLGAAGGLAWYGVTDRGERRS